MKKISVIEFDRSDLRKSSKNKKIEDIIIFDFKGNLALLKIREAAIVIFKDDDGRIFVLKDRYNQLCLKNTY